MENLTDNSEQIDTISSESETVDGKTEQQNTVTEQAGGAETAATAATEKPAKKAKQKMNLPNRLTLLRIFLIPVFIVVYFVEFEGHRLAAMIIYFLACITDFFDGYLARKNNIVTNFGKFVDPIADKMIIACSLIAICVTDPVVQPANVYRILFAVFAMLILSRELMISVFRTVAASKNVVMAADMIGKFKTVVQMAALFALLPVTDFAVWNPIAGKVFFYGGFGLLALATLLTVISGIHYLVKNKAVLED